jgi:hypothetical protein
MAVGLARPQPQCLDEAGGGLERVGDHLAGGSGYRGQQLSVDLAADQLATRLARAVALREALHLGEVAGAESTDRDFDSIVVWMYVLIHGAASRRFIYQGNDLAVGFVMSPSLPRHLHKCNRKHFSI